GLDRDRGPSPPTEEQEKRACEVNPYGLLLAVYGAPAAVVETGGVRATGRPVRVHRVSRGPVLHRTEDRRGAGRGPRATVAPCPRLPCPRPCARPRPAAVASPQSSPSWPRSSSSPPLRPARRRLPRPRADPVRPVLPAPT